MPLDFNDVAFALFHPIMVVFIAFILGLLLLDHPIKRTIGFITSSICLSIIFGYIFDNFTGSNPINTPFQYLIPIIINTLIAIYFLYLDSSPQPKNTHRDKKDLSEGEDEGLEDFNTIKIKKKFSTQLIDEYFNNSSFIKTEYENTVITPNGVIIFYHKQNLTSFVLLNVDLFSYLVYSQTTDKSTDEHLTENILFELKKYNVSIRRMELSPIIYYPQRMYNKYNDIILNKYAKQVIALAQNDEHIITNIKEKANIMTFIKNQSNPVSLPNEWIIIKLHHHFETQFNSSNDCQILLDELLISFESNIAICQQSFPDFKRLTAITDFSKDSLLLLHKQDMPPLYLLVPLDNNLIDHLFQREMNTKQNLDKQSIFQDQVQKQNSTEELENQTLITDSTVNNVNTS